VLTSFSDLPAKCDETKENHVRFKCPSFLHRQDDMQEVHFVGQAVEHRATTQWMVTWALLSNGMAVSTPEEVCCQNESVNAFMHSHGLVHMGWLRVVSQGGPLTMHDIRKQKVCYWKSAPLHDGVATKCAVFAL
jgi:hypothetical protein